MKMDKDLQNALLKNMDQNDKDKLNAGKKREQLSAMVKAYKKLPTFTKLNFCNFFLAIMNDEMKQILADMNKNEKARN